MDKAGEFIDRYAEELRRISEGKSSEWKIYKRYTQDKNIEQQILFGCDVSGCGSIATNMLLHKINGDSLKACTKHAVEAVWHKTELKAGKCRDID